MTVDSGTDANTRPSAAFTASQSAFDVTPLGPLMLPMALWCAAAAALKSLGSAWAPNTIILSMAFARGRWLAAVAATPAALRHEVQRAWRHFNRIGEQEGCPALPDWRDGQGAWAQASRASRAALLAQSDLVTQLTHFVASSG